MGDPGVGGVRLVRRVGGILAGRGFRFGLGGRDFEPVAGRERVVAVPTLFEERQIARGVDRVAEMILLATVLLVGLLAAGTIGALLMRVLAPAPGPPTPLRLSIPLPGDATQKLCLPGIPKALRVMREVRKIPAVIRITRAKG